VLPEYETLADLISRLVRIDLHRWCTEAQVMVRAFSLPDAQPHSASATSHFDERWTANGPLRRPAAAMLAHLENAGQPLDRREAHNQYLARSTTDAAIDCFLDLSWRYWRRAQRYLTDGPRLTRDHIPAARGVTGFWISKAGRCY